MILEQRALPHTIPLQLAFSGQEDKEIDIWKDFKLLLLVVVKWEEGVGSKTPSSSGWKVRCSVDRPFNSLVKTFSCTWIPPRGCSNADCHWGFVRRGPSPEVLIHFGVRSGHWSWLWAGLPLFTLSRLVQGQGWKPLWRRAAQTCWITRVT